MTASPKPKNVLKAFSNRPFISKKANEKSLGFKSQFVTLQV